MPRGGFAYSCVACIVLVGSRGKLFLPTRIAPGESGPLYIDVKPLLYSYAAEQDSLHVQSRYGRWWGPTPVIYVYSRRGACLANLIAYIYIKSVTSDSEEDARGQLGLPAGDKTCNVLLAYGL